MIKVTHIKAVNRKIEEYKLVDGAIYSKMTNKKTGNIQKDWKQVNMDSVLRVHASLEDYWNFLVGWAVKHPVHSLS